MAVTGALINAAAILAGGLAGIGTHLQVRPGRQQQIQKILGALTVFAGLSVAWSGLQGSLGQFLGKGLVVLLSLMLGKLTGHWLRLQGIVNRAGRFASQHLTRSQTTDAMPFGDVFTACAAVYCLAPLAVLGSLAEGLRGDLKPLMIKSIMDGLAAMAFARSVGRGVLVSALPVFVWQGTLTLGVRWLSPFLEDRMLVDTLSATTGFLVFAVALVILKLRRIELADYLPSLLYAPAITLVFRQLGIG